MKGPSRQHPKSALLRGLENLRQNPLALAGAIIVLLVVLISLSAPLLPLPDPAQTQLDARLLPPGSPGHLLGTDLLGRDILSRLVWGTQLSLAVAAAATFIAAVVGSTIGLSAGYFGGKLDGFLMRSIDMVMAFPYLLLALAIVAVLGPGLFNALIAISIVNIPFFARTVRGTTVGLARREFVDTARMSGRSEIGILLAEILPNALPVIIITCATTLGWMILETAGLSFLGLGAQPPLADLGSMLGDSRTLLLIEPVLALLPGVVVFIIVIGINLLGDGLRDALDPRLSGGPSGRPSAATRVDPKKAATPTPRQGKLLSVSELCAHFETRHGTVHAVRKVSLELDPGETLGIVGESGSGKSVTALSLTRLLPSPPARITSGALSFGNTNLLTARLPQIRAIRGNRIAYVFQDPLTTLNPLFTVGDQVSEAIRIHRSLSRKDAWREAVQLLEDLEIADADSRASSFPHELSGGMRQRVGIAMALANHPDLLIADEPTTALDVTVQRTVLDILRRRIATAGTALIFISHDLSLVSELCERIAVMYAGQIVETGPTREVLARPAHPYTRRLLDCLPTIGGGRRELRPIPGTPPQLDAIPHGCAFADRCDWAIPECRQQEIPLESLDHASRTSRCIRHETIIAEDVPND